MTPDQFHEYRCSKSRIIEDFGSERLLSSRDPTTGEFGATNKHVLGLEGMQCFSSGCDLYHVQATVSPSYCR